LKGIDDVTAEQPRDHQRRRLLKLSLATGAAVLLARVPRTALAAAAPGNVRSAGEILEKLLA
jgi:hypothetical protein